MTEENYNIKIQVEDVIKAPNTFVEAYAFSKCVSRIELFNKTKDVFGHIVECGVHKGQGVSTLAHLLCSQKRTIFTKQVFGFDTFEGFQSVSEEDFLTRENKDGMLSDVNFQHIQACMQNIPSLYGSADQRVVLIQGDACYTIPEFLGADSPFKDINISLLILDFDLYQPTKVALQYLASRVVKGGIIAVDDMYSNVYPGVRKAVNEVMNVEQLEIKDLDYDPWLVYWKKN